MCIDVGDHRVILLRRRDDVAEVVGGFLRIDADLVRKNSMNHIVAGRVGDRVKRAWLFRQGAVDNDQGVLSKRIGVTRSTLARATHHHHLINDLDGVRGST